MNNAQAEYIAEHVAELAKHHSGHIIINVIPPQTPTAGELDFAFSVVEIPQAVEGERQVHVRIVE